MKAIVRLLLLACTGAVLAGCHGALPAGPAVGNQAALPAARTAAGLPASLVNRSGRRMRMYLIGQNGGGTWVALNASGKLVVLGAHAAPAIEFPKGKKEFTLPYLSSARAYFVAKPASLSIILSGGGPAWPQEWLKGDPSYTSLSDWFEYTYASAGSQLYINATQVNIFGLPFEIAVDPKSSNNPAVSSVGFGNGARANIFDGMHALPDFKNLEIRKVPDGRKLRIINPGYAIEYGGAPFPANYLDDYISKVWTYYASHTMKLNTMLTASGPYYTGRAIAATFTFRPDTGSGPTVTIKKPNTQDTFNCAGSLGQPGTIPGRISAQICAALNRGTALIDPHNQPDYNEADFYKVTPTNLFSKVVHEFALHGLAYGFADDDQGSFSSTFSNSSPTKLTVTISKF